VKRRRFFATSIFLLSFALSGCHEFLAHYPEVPRITKEELRSLLGNPDVIILDVRIEEHWKESKSKIQGAVREDPEKDINTWADKYPKDKTLVFYCA
jgi:rhodanese-related sulfurtransferase